MSHTRNEIQFNKVDWISDFYVFFYVYERNEPNVMKEMHLTHLIIWFSLFFLRNLPLIMIIILFKIYDPFLFQTQFIAFPFVKFQI